MATSISLFFSVSSSLQRHHLNLSSFSLRQSHFLSPNPLSGPHTLLFPTSPIRRRRTPQTPTRVVISAVQSNFFKVLQTVLRVGKDGIEAGTNLVPDVVPRPIARIGVAVVLVTVSIFVLRSFLSTAFFVLAMMGFIYFVYIALNKDEGPRGGGGTGATDEETLEEARRIMEKYK